MATEDVLPQIINRLFSGNFNSQVDDNTPFQGFSAPDESTSVTDTVTTLVPTRPAHYGQAYYGSALYGN